MMVSSVLGRLGQLMHVSPRRTVRRLCLQGIERNKIEMGQVLQRKEKESSSLNGKIEERKRIISLKLTFTYLVFNQLL